ATEVRLQLDDGVAALAGEPPHAGEKQLAQALRQERAAEELDGLAVLVATLSEVHLPEVGCELGLLVLAARYVRVRRHDLAPRLEGTCGRRLDERATGLPLLVAHLLVEADPEGLRLHLLDLLRLGPGRDRTEQPAHGVE